jgi:RNA polymerase sigma factor (sigma-70 family)
MKPPDDMNELGNPNDLNDPSETDEALFMRWRQNHDDAAYYALDARYRQRLLGLVGRTLKRNQASAAALACDVDDIVQDVFTALNNCPDPVGSVRAVLYQAVQSHLLDLIRASKAGKRDYRKTVHSDEMSHYVADPHAEPAIRDDEIDVKEAVGKLSPGEQQAVRLELDGHSHASGAKVASVPQTTYWSRLRSARKRLKELLAPPIILLAIVGSAADGCDLDVYVRFATATCW